MKKSNFDYDKAYNAGWKDAIEEIEQKLAEKGEVSELRHLIRQMKEKSA